MRDYYRGLRGFCQVHQASVQPTIYITWAGTRCLKSAYIVPRFRIWFAGVGNQILSSGGLPTVGEWLTSSKIQPTSRSIRFLPTPQSSKTVPQGKGGGIFSGIFSLMEVVSRSRVYSKSRAGAISLKRYGCIAISGCK